MQADIKAFRIMVKNRRQKVENSEGPKEHYEPVFKTKLWKVKGEGDRTEESHWFLRDMWISKNGCLVYWSPKDERELVYYTAEDMQRCTTAVVPNDKSNKPWTFQIQLPA